MIIEDVLPILDFVQSGLNGIVLFFVLSRLGAKDFLKLPEDSGDVVDALFISLSHLGTKVVVYARIMRQVMSDLYCVPLLYVGAQ